MDNLQRANEFHVALLAMAGHDLRQPLQSLIGAHDWLARRFDDALTRKYIERGQIAIGQLVEQLDHLVGALHVHERAADIAAAPIELLPLLCALEREQREFAEQKDVRLRVVATNTAIMSDEILLEGILRNLTRNAVKYTQPHGHVLVGCRRRGEEVRIEVHDTGVGMPSDKVAMVFQAFYRLDPGRPDGLGLGLFVVKRAVELLGHRIEVSSTPGRGSCFTMIAPEAARARLPVHAA